MATARSLIDIDPWLEPHAAAIRALQQYVATKSSQLLGDMTVQDFALGHLYFGLIRTATGWVIREWAPNATAVSLVGTCNDWQVREPYQLRRLDGGVWERELPAHAIAHGDSYKLRMCWQGGEGFRVPAWAQYVVQDAATLDFSASVWQPEQAYVWRDAQFVPPRGAPRIYEAHIGMASEEGKVASYAEFEHDVLPRIAAGGYTTLQLMAIQEHPYYGSFGYHVSSFFAPSSRFGTPDGLRSLVDAAHGLGMQVIMDLVHSHAVKNEREGLSRFDGTTSQYFHAGARGDHVAWDSRCFDYGKAEVQHFLLSNCRYWLDAFHFDGFRFDGVTSMLYVHHGLGKDFTSYDDYFDGSIDKDAVTYLSLANQLIHEVKPYAVTIAEEMSALPGLCASVETGGIGFDYRLAMGAPDMWVRLLKTCADDDWDVEVIFRQLSQHRPEEKTISYAESHDQAIVGDKTIIQWLIDEELYTGMQVNQKSLRVDRGIALHKMIRLLTACTYSGGYLAFMGNEFGHPEWIDFPREGNEWSYQYARRQWHLADDTTLKYHWLGVFDADMMQLLQDMHESQPEYVAAHVADHVVSFVRDNMVCCFNFHPEKSYTDYGIAAPQGAYEVVLSTDAKQYGGFGRIDSDMQYPVAGDGSLRLYLPARTAVVLKLAT